VARQSQFPLLVRVLAVLLPGAAVLLAVALRHAVKVDEAPRIVRDPAPPVTDMSEEQILHVLDQNKKRLTHACWLDSNAGLTDEAVTVQITVGPWGNVESVKPEGTDPDLTLCVASEVRSWHFPRASRMPIQIPFQFLRE
jgi:hypothetical protein